MSTITFSSAAGALMFHIRRTPAESRMPVEQALGVADALANELAARNVPARVAIDRDSDVASIDTAFDALSLLIEAWEPAPGEFQDWEQARAAIERAQDRIRSLEVS